MIQKLDSPMVSTDATGQLPKGITLSDDKLISLRARKPTDNLSSSLELKFGARVMLINNIDISDKLIKDRLAW